MNKRIPQLLEGFTLLRQKRPGARLLLVGEPAERFATWVARADEEALV